METIERDYDTTEIPNIEDKNRYYMINIYFGTMSLYFSIHEKSYKRTPKMNVVRKESENSYYVVCKKIESCVKYEADLISYFYEYSLTALDKIHKRRLPKSEKNMLYHSTAQRIKDAYRDKAFKKFLRKKKITGLVD